MATRESKEARKERQAIEEWQMIELLKRCGASIEAEVPISKPEDDGRPWRVDYIIDGKVALEIEGYGRHQSWKGWHSDLAKYNWLSALGLRLVRVTREMVANGDALEALARCGVAVEGK